MSDTYLFVFMNIMFFLIGFPLVKLLPSNTFKMRLLIAPTIGYGISAVIITVLYKWGISINLAFRIFLVVALIIGLWFCYQAYNKFKAREKFNFLQANKKILILLLMWIAGSIILLAPKWTGGNQFAVFQGNTHDTFGYLNSAVVYAKEPYQTIINADEKSRINNPLMSYARGNLYGRPSVHILYSFVGQLLPFQNYKLYYTFLIFFFSQAILVFMFFVVNILKTAKPVFTGLVALAFPLGFWGQYILDINAWSQISSVPILFLIVALTVLVFGNYYDKKISMAIFIRTMILFTLFSASATYLYPEGLLFHLPVISLLTGIYCCYCMSKKYNWPISFTIFAGIICGILTGFLFYDGTIGFVLKQAKWVNTNNVSWWQYFQAFLNGKDGLNNSLINNIIDAVAGFVGFYFVTPKTDSTVIALFARMVILVFSTYILANLLFYIKDIISKKNSNINLNNSGRLAVLFFLTFLLLSTLPIVYFLLSKNYWAAGKALSYISPYYILFICIPVLKNNEKKNFKNFTNLLFIFIIFQISFGVIRINAVAKPDGIHYERPYPTVENLKESIDWDMDKLYPHIKNSKLISIDIKNRFIENYCMVYLYTINKKFYTVNVVNDYLGGGIDLGYQRPEGEADFIINDSTFARKDQR
ncbi:MAG: hypothetical protein M1365_09630 [Actinobacteria bacterium]|nr:hypothetical protein [Actinomycetota bacterium]